jgi:hypothetical protein
MTTTTTYKKVLDTYDDVTCVRIEGAGDMPAGAFQAEHFPNEEWTAWYSIEAEPCGCFACNDGVQPGHFACMLPPATLLQAEAEGLVTRHYTDGAWRWFVV